MHRIIIASLLTPILLVFTANVAFSACTSTGSYAGYAVKVWMAVESWPGDFSINGKVCQKTSSGSCPVNVTALNNGKFPSDPSCFSIRYNKVTTAIDLDSLVKAKGLYKKMKPGGKGDLNVRVLMDRGRDVPGCHRVKGRGSSSSNIMVCVDSLSAK